MIWKKVEPKDIILAKDFSWAGPFYTFDDLYNRFDVDPLLLDAYNDANEVISIIVKNERLYPQWQFEISDQNNREYLRFPITRKKALIEAYRILLNQRNDPEFALRWLAGDDPEGSFFSVYELLAQKSSDLDMIINVLNVATKENDSWIASHPRSVSKTTSK